MAQIHFEENWEIAIHLVVQHKASLIGTNTSNGQNILHCLAKQPFDEDSKFLMEQAIKQSPDLINQRDMLGNTPLHIAMLENNFKNAKELLSILFLVQKAKIPRFRSKNGYKKQYAVNAIGYLFS